ncbi:MAG: tetratricopeptide repeat protein, partial [Lachnospiraceae bacterium]|nr:tetratricopeptide repeat protein [Lachnospiraceae bacterium]
MNTEEILQTLDMLFDSHQLEQIEPFLMEPLDHAFAHGDNNCCLTILNELIGYYRDMSRFDEMLAACDRATQFLEQLGLQDSIPYATTLLNIATALRAMGNYDAALEEYKKVFPIYQRELEPTDTRFAALYNNISLLYQDMGNFRQSVAAQNQALHILEGSDDTQKLAISHSNLGTTLLQMERMDEALVHLNYAVQLFDSLPGDKDYHYSAALASLGQVYVMKEDYETARGYYLTALEEYRKTHGVTQSYYNLLDNLHYVEEQLGVELTPDPAAGEQSEAELSTASAQSEPDTSTTAVLSEPNAWTTVAQDEEQTAPDLPDDENQIGANPSLSEQSDSDSSVSEQAGEASSAAPKQSDPDLYVAPKRAGTRTSTSSIEYDAAISESSQPFISAEAAPEVGKMNTDHASADDASQSERTGFGMQLAQSFYEQAFLPLFSRYAPECMDKMAVGLAGEGSDCFGFDDAVSQDHDFGPGLCIWLTHDDYETYGEQLSELYQMLPQEFNGYQRHVVIENGRVGVFDMDRFFARFTGYSRAEDIADIQ